MIFRHVHHALAQVEEIRSRFLDRQLFRGYSGPARAVGGCAALGGSIFMGDEQFPRETTVHIIGWGVVFLIAAASNYGALFIWYRSEKIRDPTVSLRPTIDALPALVVGGVLTLSLVLNSSTQYLFGVWMVIFGLVNTSSRHVLPREIWYLGLFYIAAGSMYLLVIPSPSFTNPWYMGVVFGVGELFGSAIFLRNRPSSQL